MLLYSTMSSALLILIHYFLFYFILFYCLCLFTTISSLIPPLPFLSCLFPSLSFISCLFSSLLSLSLFCPSPSSPLFFLSLLVSSPLSSYPSSSLLPHLFFSLIFSSLHLSRCRSRKRIPVPRLYCFQVLRESGKPQSQPSLPINLVRTVYHSAVQFSTVRSSITQCRIGLHSAE